MSRMILEQIAEGLNCSLQNIRIILFKGSGEIIFKQADVKEFLAFPANDRYRKL